VHANVQFCTHSMHALLKFETIFRLG